ncbi:TonB-dependent receptor [Persicobacter psychrovividus]|uniref:SusC/RagA family TonB-linked outer membrane protein n=1 Tax=Persicobacter psychrovividus TaxID=387638 RepID=A0ABM7VBG8_9BACT|nr:SusC/RagA family TonB-linked outer membrane protein [Persicobacter psychrovividus]
MKRAILLSLMLLFTAFTVFAQGKVVSGTVTAEESGEPIPGVNVLIKGTASGTITDIDGNYSINASGNDVIIFTFIGLATEEVKVGTQTNINMTMTADIKQLEDVVIVGYTKVDQATTVPVIANVKEIVTPNVAQALTGKSTGVAIQASTGQPGAKTNVRIRGIGSITGNSNPLYVIDGIIMDSDEVITANQQAERDPLANINPTDIEDIRILKDAAATALYGARASNGVIVITTKKGKAGKTNFTASISEGATSRYQGNFKMMDSPTFSKFHGEDFDPATGVNTNWGDLAFQTGRTSDYQVSASGGNEKTRYYASGGYFNQEGILVGSNFERYSGRLSVDNQVSDRMKVSFGVDLSKSIQSDASDGNLYSSPLLGSYLQAPLIDPYDADGNAYDVLPTGPWTAIRANFISDVDKNYRKTESLWGGVSGKLDYQLMEGLSFRSTNAYRFENMRKDNFSSPTSYDGADAVAPGNLAIYQGYSGTFTTTNLFNYETTIDKHNITALAGTEYQQSNQDWNYMYGAGFPEPINNIGSATQQFSLDGRGTAYRFFSFLSQVTYNFDDRYFASVSYRRDGSSRFGSSNQFGDFYSIGGSWKVSNESFWNSNVFEDLKLRASYGTTGNAGIGNFNSIGMYRYAIYNGRPAAYHSQIANPDLTWEVKHKSNIGFDVRVAKRVTVNFDAYHENSTDLLLDVPLAGETGFNSVTMNAGSMVNKGVELNISSDNIDQGDFTWSTDFNISFNHNEVTSMNGIEPIRSSFNTIEEGKAMYTFYMPEWMGAEPNSGAAAWYVNKDVADADRTENMFEAANGKLATTNYSEAARIDGGSALPVWVGGLTNRFTYRGFDASFLFTFSGGNYIYNGTRRFIDSDGIYPYNQMAAATEDRWEAPGDNASRPAYGSLGNQHSTRYVEKGDYIQLRNITLGYTLPNEFVSQIGLSKVRVFVSGQNLWMGTNYSGYTPTTVDYDGYNFFEYPEGRVFTGGLTVSF